MPRISPLHVAPTTPRQTEPGRFDTALRGAAEGATRGLAQTLSLAAPFVPGGPILAAAIHGAATATPPVRAGGGIAGAAAAGAVSGAQGGDLLDATRALQAEAQAFNLQYLQLQERTQRESREFTALSNVMKVRHDTAKAAVQNIH